MRRVVLTLWLRSDYCGRNTCDSGVRSLLLRFGKLETLNLGRRIQTTVVLTSACWRTMGESFVIRQNDWRVLAAQFGHGSRHVRRRERAANTEVHFVQQWFFLTDVNVSVAPSDPVSHDLWAKLHFNQTAWCTTHLVACIYLSTVWFVCCSLLAPLGLFHKK